RLPARVLLPSGERPAPTEAGAETGAAAERHWRSLAPRHAVLEWMWESALGNGEGPVSPGSRRKSQNRRCWFGAAGNFAAQTKQKKEGISGSIYLETWLAT